MSGIFSLFRRTLADRRGAVIVEFALLGPLAIAMMLGVLQIGIALQSYNAIRNVSADTARHTAVAYQTNNKLSDTQIRQYALATAITAPYLLQNSGLTISCADAATQPITGATEKTLSISYQVPSILTLLGYSSPSINFTRPIFVAN